MFRYSVRDLLWLTFVVALALSWWIDRQRLRAELQIRIDQANQLATKWNMAARAVGETLTDDGCKITWDLESSKVDIVWPQDTRGWTRRRYFSIDPANAPNVYEYIDDN